MTHSDIDLLVVGGGINGAGIARDAAGRGLRVMLVEQGDLAGATSSASSKLVHGGLRYLEQLEFRLVAEALREREILLRAAPHLVRPMRFVMPLAKQFRSPWMIRTGLFLYDWLARRDILPGSEAIRLAQSPYGHGLKPGFQRAFAYSDCWVDDARLVLANALSARSAGADIRSRTRCVSLQRAGTVWMAQMQMVTGEIATVNARAVVNAAGPWAHRFLIEVAGERVQFKLRLVQGSHIIVPRLFPGTHAFILQHDDGRVIFAYAYGEHYTLVGTTDLELSGPVESAHVTDAEKAYLCNVINTYFTRQTTPEDVVTSFTGVRPLYDDGADNPSRVTRDYTLHLSGGGSSAPLLSVFGGKITTYRCLAEQALERLRPWFPGMREAWTAGAALWGGEEMPEALDRRIAQTHAWLPADYRSALVHRYGSRYVDVLSSVRSPTDLGPEFAPTLYGCEVDYLVSQEWAMSAEDVLWRRTKCGYEMTDDQRQNLTRSRSWPVSQ
jgi:glycerol-3-phosphate dehydrogenase